MIEFSKDICKECEGVGVTEKSKGFFVVQQTCKKCKGDGYVDALYQVYKYQDPKPYNYDKSVMSNIFNVDFRR